MYIIASQKLGFLNLTKMKILQADSVHHAGYEMVESFQ
jgi:hypothetical protein